MKASIREHEASLENELRGKTLICGQGAIGSLFAYHFRSLDPLIFCRDSRKSKPLSLSLLNGEQYPLVFAKTDMSCFPKQNMKMIVIPVKQYQTLALSKQLHEIADQQTVFVLIQNGMGGAEILRSQFKKNPILIGTTTDAVFKKDVNVYQMISSGKLSIGEFNAYKEVHSELVRSCISTIQNLHPNVEVTEDITQILYKKLLVNAVINPLSALLNIQNGGLQQHSSKTKKIKREVFDIYLAHDIDFDEEHWSKHVDQIIEDTANNFSSMHQDMYFKRQSEIDGILGYLINLASQHNIQAEYLTELYGRIKAIEKEYVVAL